MVRSLDGGDSWTYACGTPANMSGSSGIAAYGVVAHPLNAFFLYALYQDGAVYASDNGCANWTRVAAINDTVQTLVAGAPAPSTPDAAALTAFAAGDKGVWATGPAWPAGTWTLLGGPQAWQYSTSWCRPSSDAVWLYCANAWWDQWHSGLWRLNVSAAAAAVAAGSAPHWEWLRVDSMLYRWADTPASPLLQAVASNENPYPEVSSAVGVAVSVDGGVTWSEQNVGLRMRRVSALAWSPDGAWLIAGLNGGGFYVADTSSLLAEVQST